MKVQGETNNRLSWEKRGKEKGKEERKNKNKKGRIIKIIFFQKLPLVHL